MSSSARMCDPDLQVLGCGLLSSWPSACLSAGTQRCKALPRTWTARCPLHTLGATVSAGQTCWGQARVPAVCPLPKALHCVLLLLPLGGGQGASAELVTSLGGQRLDARASGHQCLVL